MQLHTVLRCELSGLIVGSVDVEMTAGALPYLSHWDHMVVRHSVFSLGTYKLLQFTKKEWERLAKRSLDEETSEAENNMLKISWLACLHTFDSIKQDQPALPPLHIVQETLSRVLALAYWKYLIDTARMNFPEYHICQKNNNVNFENIDDYLEVCFKKKESWTARKQDIDDTAKIKAAEAALAALSREWITPVSNKILWQWVEHHLKERYPDDVHWLGSIFLGGKLAIVSWEEDEIEMFEEYVEAACPGGTGIMGAVRSRIAKIWEIWKDHHSVFEIDLEDYAINQGLKINGAAIVHPDPGPEPQRKDYNGSLHKYYIASAKWSVAKAAFDGQNRRSSDPDVNTDLGAI